MNKEERIKDRQSEKRARLETRKNRVTNSLDSLIASIVQKGIDEADTKANVKGKHIGECNTACDGTECRANRLTAELNQINEAIAALDKETYGICQDCQKKIGSGRLKIKPEAKRCCACASEYEDFHKQPGRTLSLRV